MYGGDRYEVTVPDTLDLAERAELALHTLTDWGDPDCKYAVICDAAGFHIGLRKKDVLTLEFPMVEETVEYTVADGECSNPLPEGVHWVADPGPYELPRTRYTCYFKGNTLVDITPRQERRWLRLGKHPYPIYPRDHYKANKAPMKKVTRYVAPYTISW